MLGGTAGGESSRMHSRQLLLLASAVDMQIMPRLSDLRTVYPGQVELARHSLIRLDSSFNPLTRSVQYLFSKHE